MKLLDSLTSRSVIAAPTAFEPVDEPCRSAPALVPAPTGSCGGGNDGSSFADSLTSAAVSGVSEVLAEFVAA
ncbi:hypothetical protein WI36_25240 [Burkholderia ubonensis]|nr:hypothetical protein WI36_25240 [Burkholderia ubonensis]